MKIKQDALNLLQEVAGEKNVHLEIPELSEHGDFSTNVAMQSAPKGTSPRDYAAKLVEKLQKDKRLSKVVEKIEVAGPGFINFWLKNDVLVNNLIQIDEDFGKTKKQHGKTYLLEHTSPNTIKTLHVGHVRNNVLGMAISQLLKANGAEVRLDAINNDRGIHVMKAVWAYIKYGGDKTPEDEGLKPDHFVDKFYVTGAKEFKNDEDVETEIRDLLIKWEDGDEEIRKVWKKLRDWTFEGFKKTYKRLGSRHDKQWFESEFYEKGKEMVGVGLDKGVFKKLDDGAVLTNLSDFGLTDTIVQRSDGTSMYLTQDLYLTKQKREVFPSDFYIWDIGPEQELYLKQLFAVCEQLGLGKRSDYMHLAYGYVYLKGQGKMSSRAGNVISADELMDTVVSHARQIIDSSENGKQMSDDEKTKIAEEVGLGAIKYGFLKLSRLTDLQFDIDESLSLEGNSGPYLQYTYARTQSVLAKSKTQNPKSKDNLPFEIGNLKLEINDEEGVLLRSFVHFPEVVAEAAEKYAPNLVCNYLYDLAQKYNTFYNKHKIISSENEDLRLALTSATGTVLKNGLDLLGIKAPEKM